MRTGSNSYLVAAAFGAGLAGAILFTPPLHAAEVIRVHLKNLTFSPAEFTAHVGDTVEWINGDFVAHTATARNGDWDVSLPANSSRKLLLKHAGAVDFYCRFHPGMTGRAKIAAGG